MFDTSVWTCSVSTVTQTSVSTVTWTGYNRSVTCETLVINSVQPWCCPPVWQLYVFNTEKMQLIIMGKLVMLLIKAKWNKVQLKKVNKLGCTCLLKPLLHWGDKKYLCDLSRAMMKLHKSLHKTDSIHMYFQQLFYLVFHCLRLTGTVLFMSSCCFPCFCYSLKAPAWRICTSKCLSWCYLSVLVFFNRQEEIRVWFSDGAPHRSGRHSLLHLYYTLHSKFEIYHYIFFFLISESNNDVNLKKKQHFL